MLYDRARIHVQAGGGGDGCLSFRREAHVPRGGPDGGDGAQGGDVVLVCDDSLRDLQSFRRRAHYRAPRGGHGEGAMRHGADGEPLVVRVPPGTQVEGEQGEVAGRRWDLVAAGQRAMVAHGGSGGRGNKRFATATRQAPRFCERGLPGEEGWLNLRLKLLADIGLVGLPNAGKSSLLARMTRAAPKVAGYPFTTLEPVLGTLQREERQLIIADIPGLIEGASTGVGLGHEFLAHVERTQVLVHVVELAPQRSGAPDADPVANFEVVERELAAHDQRLARLPRVLALSKADLLEAGTVGQAVKDWSRRLGDSVPIVATSAATGEGLQELGTAMLRLVDQGPAAGASSEGSGSEATLRNAGGLPAAVDAGAAISSYRADVRPGADSEALAEHRVFRPAARRGFEVRRTGPRSFLIAGSGVERMLLRYDIDNEEAMAHLEGRLRRIGVLRALEAQGFQAGDEIEISGQVFELDPSAPA